MKAKPLRPVDGRPPARLSDIGGWREASFAEEGLPGPEAFFGQGFFLSDVYIR
jgi:hypothetical protein